MLKTFTDNPIPTALVGMGVYWLLKDSANSSDTTLRKYGGDGTQWRNQEKYGEPPMQEQIIEKFQTAKNTVQGHVSELKEQAGQQAHAWKEQASRQAQEWKDETGKKLEDMQGYLQEQSTVARGEFNHILETNPLALGAVMVALGATVAALIPGSPQEDQWMGESRDKVINAVKTTVQTTVEDAKQTAGKVAEKVLHEGERQAT